MEDIIAKPRSWLFDRSVVMRYIGNSGNFPFHHSMTVTVDRIFLVLLGSSPNLCRLRNHTRGRTSTGMYIMR